MIKFNVLNWDINRNELVSYDVMPYFVSKYQDLKKKDRPISREQWVEFVKRKGMYMFWSRCEYEILVSEWPPVDNPERSKHIKIDIWQQIEMNLDVIVDLLMSELCK